MPSLSWRRANPPGWIFGSNDSFSAGTKARVKHLLRCNVPHDLDRGQGQLAHHLLLEYEKNLVENSIMCSQYPNRSTMRGIFLFQMLVLYVIAWTLRPHVTIVGLSTVEIANLPPASMPSPRHCRHLELNGYYHYHLARSVCQCFRHDAGASKGKSQVASTLPNLHA